MTRAKFRDPIRVEVQCRCGRWKRFRADRCVTCEIRRERENADQIKARLRRKLDPQYKRPAYDEHGRVR